MNHKAGTNYELCTIFIHLFVHSSTHSLSKYFLSAYYVLKFLCCTSCWGYIQTCPHRSSILVGGGIEKISKHICEDLINIRTLEGNKAG